MAGTNPAICLSAAENSAGYIPALDPNSIVARRFCASRTPSAVGTSRPVLPTPTASISPAGNPSATRPFLTEVARRPDRA